MWIFTWLGNKNYYITDHSKAVYNNSIHDVRIESKGHRLNGVRELVYVVNDVEQLKNLFGMFNCVTTGHFEQSMFDMKSNFHWIYLGEKV